MRKTIRILFAFVLLVAIAATAIVVYFMRVTGDEGTSALEEWIGQQLREVAGAHLNVELAFEKPDYQYPATIVVENIRLTAPDPAASGKTIDIIRIGKATLTVAEIPAVGQPLHIERVVLEKPQFSFVCTSAADSALVGFSNLVKTGEARPAEADAPGVEVSKSKITDVFRIRMVHLIGGTVFYDPRNADKRAMTIDRINIAMNVEPDKDGWYSLNTKIDRLPIGELDIAGRFNLNDNILDLAKLALKIKLGGENNASLPPQMQGFLADYGLVGDLDVAASGLIEFADWKHARFDVNVGLKAAQIAFGEYQVKVEQLSLAAEMRHQEVKVSRLDVNALGGWIRGSGRLTLDRTLDSQLNIEGADLRIHRIFKAGADDNTREPLPFRGKLKFKIDAFAPLTGLTKKLTGGGYVMLREGRLLKVQAINIIEDNIAGVGKSNDDKRLSPGAKDDVDLIFAFKNDRIRMDRIDYRSSLVAMRGNGEILLDGLVLNLLVHGGPIEKLQSLLGPVGDLTALVTDRVAKYHITGRVGEPKVKAIIAEGIFDKLFGG